MLALGLLPPILFLVLFLDLPVDGGIIQTPLGMDYLESVAFGQKMP